jgi:glucose-1-phosphate cytidylyltransferase
VDTGHYAPIGQRLKAVEHYLEGEEVFLANYSDGLSDLPLPVYLDNFYRNDAIASFVCVRPSQSFHIVTLAESNVVKDIRHVDHADLWINGGFFAFKREIFDYVGDREDLVAEPFQRLIEKGGLVAYKHDGFWACMDTFKDKQRLDEVNAKGDCPWAVWRSDPPRPAAPMNGGREGSRRVPLARGEVPGG